VYSIGLVTAESPRAVEAVAGEETYNVFLPNSPNPTGGRLLVVPADQIHEIEMSVQRDATDRHDGDGIERRRRQPAETSGEFVTGAGRAQEGK